MRLEEARDELAEAFEEMKKVELLDERDQQREKAAESKPTRRPWTRSAFGGM